MSFWPKVNILQGNYCILLIDMMPSCQKSAKVSWQCFKTLYFLKWCPIFDGSKLCLFTNTSTRVQSKIKKSIEITVQWIERFSEGAFTILGNLFIKTQNFQSRGKKYIKNHENKTVSSDLTSTNCEDATHCISILEQ